MKLIVSDLDGTLLGKNEVFLNKNIKNSIYSILDTGNIFAVASGRNYIELKHLFSEFEKDIYFICNDGTLGVYKEETFFDKPMEKDMFKDFREFTAHAKYITYVKSSSSLFIRKTMKKYRGHVATIDSVYDIKEAIYKISDFDKTVFCPLPVVYKDYSMNEYITENLDKANAVKYLIDKLKIPQNRTFAFGDNLNDIGIFKVCGNSFAVANALPKVKKIADKVTPNIEKELLSIL